MISQSRLNNAQAEGIELDNQDKQNKLDDYEARKNKEFAKMDAEEAKLRSEANLNDIKREVEDLNRQLKAGELQYQPELYDKIFKKYDEEINNIKSNTNLNEETKNLRIEEINKARQETKESQARTAVQWSIKSLNEEEKKKLGEEYNRLVADNKEFYDTADIRKAAADLQRFYDKLMSLPSMREMLEDLEFSNLMSELKESETNQSKFLMIWARVIDTLSPFSSVFSSAVRPPSVTNRYNNYTTNYR